jgi:uncharacterized protein YjbI with pentapeptide repeats
MDDQQKTGEQPTGRLILWIGLSLAVLAIAILIGYRYGITLWDWIKLLIVPGVIAGGGFWFNRQQRERELETAREQRARDVEIAERRTQDEALQAYLDQMGQLLLDKDRPLRQSKEGAEVRTLARARTLTILSRLGRARKRSAVEFLHESGLVRKDRPVLDLKRADLREADLIGADLREADLGGAHLMGADLSETNLSGGSLSKALLGEALLIMADLSGADLSGAELIGADLGLANLREADLRGANLWGADLRHAQEWTVEQFSAARNLKGATMPDGQTLGSSKTPDGPTFEEWLNSQSNNGA